MPFPAGLRRGKGERNLATKRVSYAELPKKKATEFPLQFIGEKKWKGEDEGSISSEGDTEQDLGSGEGNTNGMQANQHQFYHPLHSSCDSSTSDNRRPSRLVESCRYIWSPQDVATSLKSLRGGETLWNLLEARIVLNEGCESVLTEEEAAKAIGKAAEEGYGETALLIAAWCAHSSLIRHLLVEIGIDANAVDGDGRTALHLACCAGDEESTKILLSYGAKPDAWDTDRRATPIHCAACSGSPQCMQLLIDAGIDLDLGISEGKTALFYAVQVNSLECVRLLLSSGANPNTPQVFTETPLHVAAAFGFSECLRQLLEGGADVRVQFGHARATALHLAAQDGNADCARLLLDAEADIAATNHRRQTPLHLAALAQSTETLELLIQRGADINAVDVDKRTPLHCAIVKESRSCDCVRLLLVKGAEFNCADAFGYTPLHIAALHEFSSCVALLINAGADVMARTNGGVSALTFVVRRTPDALPCFIERLDAAVALHDHDLGDADCEIRLDFRPLLPPHPPIAKNIKSGSDRRDESAMLLGFVEVGMRHMLKHPLCETFLFLKWRRIRKFFLISLAFHLIFVTLYTTFVVGVFSRSPGTNETECSNRLGNSEVSDDLKIDIGIVYVGYALVFINFTLMGKEIFQLAHGFVKYANHWENWLQWLIILSVFISHGVGYRDVCQIQPFQHHVAALGIIFTWTDLMVLIGRFPTFGVYVQMFTTVSINFAKFLFAYCCLLVGFGLGLGVLFPTYPSFKKPYLALLKSVIMMSGELEYEDIFFGDKANVIYGGTSHVMFLAFVILVTVILTNLLVGLAVSDIQGLQKTARLNRLVRQSELIAHLESVLFSRLLLKVIPMALLKPCLQGALLVSATPYNRCIHLRPNDPREKRVPRHLLEAAYNLVASRSGRKKHYGKDHANAGSRRSAYKSWAMQCSFSSCRRAASISDSNDLEENDSIAQQNQLIEYLSSQIVSLAADSEARFSVVKEIRRRISAMEKSIANMPSSRESRKEIGERMSSFN